MTSKAFDNATDANRQQGGRRNLIINGAMQVWQRGTSLSAQTTDQYLADRWLLIDSDSTYNASQEDVGLADSTVPHEIEHFLRFNPTTGNNNTGVFQRIEDVRSLPEGKVAISFYAKGTNPNSGEIQVFFRQNFGTGGSAQTTEVVDTFVLTSSWQRFTVIHDVPSLSGKTLGPSNTSYVMIGFRQPDTDTSTDAWTLDITGVQLEVGTVATPFEHRSYGEELALCQRYYVSYGIASNGTYSSNQPTSLAVPLYDRNTISSGQCFTAITLPVDMRASSTFTAYRAFNGSGADINNTNWGPFTVAETARQICIQKTTDSMTGNQTMVYLVFDVDAEL